MLFTSITDFIHHIGHRTYLNLLDEINAQYTENELVLIEAVSYPTEIPEHYAEIAYHIIDNQNKNRCLYVAFIYHPQNKNDDMSKFYIDEFYEMDLEKALKLIRNNV